jgi:CRP-like cAMP-binding protein
MIDSQQKTESPLGDSPLSKMLADSELAGEIEKWSAPILFKRGETLFKQGDLPGHAYFVKTGEVTLTMRMSDDTEWRIQAGEGSILGLPAIIANEPYSLNATVSRNSNLCRISRENFHQLMQENPRFCCNVVQILAGEVLAARSALSRLLG